ncbi:MAG: amidohydrolase [Chlorobi bacterium]|nr:amidohydrolase [Chlorobiota bacterium]MCI0715038.1 amidohydrolase [Chlorobiota bacterium]
MSSALFINAKVWKPSGEFAQAFGVRESFFDFIGSNEEASSIKSNYEKIINCEGRLVLPGLIDGHLHLVKGSLMIKRFDSSGIKNIETLKTKICEYADSNPNQSWIVGSNLDANSLLKDVDTTKGNIADGIYSDKPFFINNFDYHSALCNTKALEVSELMNKLSEFSNDEVVRDSSGSPTGIIKEKAQKYMYSMLPQPSIDEKLKAAEEFTQVLHSYGITSVSDITLINELVVYKKLHDKNKLNLRINSYIPFEEYHNLNEYKKYTKEISSELFAIKGFKAYWDGALSSETALFSRNYKGKSHNGYETELVKNKEIFRLAKEINSFGMQMIIHAIGDKAVTEVLDLYESLYDPSLKTRHRIEHAQHIQEKDIARFRKLGVIASVQPIHLKYDVKSVMEKLTEDLIPLTHNYKKIIDNGGVVNFGTDFPIVQVNPFENISLALTRKTKDGTFLPELGIDLHNCIKSYTINNASSNFNENLLGAIEKGKKADFVIMKDDLFEMDTGDISNAKVWKTYFNGEEVYSNP